MQYLLLEHVFGCCLLALTQPHNRFVTRLLSCRLYIVRSQPRNLLFRCLKSLLLLFWTCSWF